MVDTFIQTQLYNSRFHNLVKRNVARKCYNNEDTAFGQEK